MNVEPSTTEPVEKKVQFEHHLEALVMRKQIHFTKNMKGLHG
jgi:hypothetical protein